MLFNGDNNDARAQKIYQNWLQRHAGSDKITGSKTADTRAALVDYFRERATIMIATEAGAEGINLQFCSLVINYELPWNPQRVEQRIGRCHRYGQQHDVVVVNFVDRSNQADARVYELMEQKFKLFDGVFGASDEILGEIGSGVDIERRIVDIYRHCRSPEEIGAAFDQLRQEHRGEINQKMQETRRVLLENFDEEVRNRLRQFDQDSRAARNRFEVMLMALTRRVLVKHADFDDDGFLLKSVPARLADSVPLGRYELPRKSGTAHLYRISHPLAQAIIAHAKECACPPERLVFDYAAHGQKVGTLEPLRGQRGHLRAHLFTVRSLNKSEQHLLLVGCTANGEALLQDDPEKLLRLPARAVGGYREPAEAMAAILDADLNRRRTDLLEEIEIQDLALISQEEDKLDGWAEDLKNNLEEGLKETEREIDEARRFTRDAKTLEEKLCRQTELKELESKRNRQRRELNAKRDEIDAHRDRLIEQLQALLEQEISVEELFRVEWELI